jgi:hypothetical protein
MGARKCEVCGAVAPTDFDALPLLARFALDTRAEPLLEPGRDITRDLRSALGSPREKPAAS